MEKFFRGLSIVCLIGGSAVYASRLARYFLPGDSPIVAFGANFADVGFESILVFLLINSQLKLVQTNRKLKKLEKSQEGSK